MYCSVLLLLLLLQGAPTLESEVYSHLNQTEEAFASNKTDISYLLPPFSLLFCLSPNEVKVIEGCKHNLLVLLLLLLLLLFLGPFFL